jgi:DNA-binding CsgD family transcriptional regulator/PAS domain-containing protein
MAGSNRAGLRRIELMGESWVRSGQVESVTYDELVLALYRSVCDASPWTQFLTLLCDQLQGCAATLVLRQPARGDRGELFSVNARLQVLEIYRTTAFPDDPFVDLDEGNACSIFDRMTRDAFLRSRYYNELLKLVDDVDILAINVGFAGNYVASLRISRRRPRDEFGLLEKSLLMRLYPHLRTALEIYERSRRQHLENNAYACAFDQLAFGVIILNERGHVVRVNEMASRIMKDGRQLRVVGNCLQAGDADQEVALSRAVGAALTGGPGAASSGTFEFAARPGSPALYALLRPIQDEQQDAGAPAAGVAIFLAADPRLRSVSIDPFARLYGLSRAEVALVTELLDGVSIAEAAAVLQISENTARAQLRSVFTKTGAHRQTDLTRMVLTSLAIIA